MAAGLIMSVAAISYASVLPLNAGWMTSLACLIMIVVGLPHGALDITAIRRVAPQAQFPVVAAYLTAAAAMFAVWWVSPLVGLGVFYLIAIAHFAHDWDEAGQPFLAHAIALALLSAPALTHTLALQGLFVALTGDPNAGLLVDALILVAPVAIGVATVGLATMGLSRQCVEGVCALIAMITLPPVIGFAIFFCLFHSPRHFREGWAALGPDVQAGTWVRIVAMTFAGIGIATLIFAVLGTPSMPVALFQTSMMTLSVLTVPHMLLASGLDYLRVRKISAVVSTI